MRTTKRKRNMSPSVAKNKKRRKATVSAHTHTATGSKVQKPYKKDRDPANCPFCNREVSRSRRVQNHVRICKSVESSIRAHQFSGNEIIKVIRKWGIPDFMFKDKATFNTKARRLELKDYIKEKRRCLKNLINSQSSDEQIVQVLREWNVPMLKNSEASFGIEADKGSAPEARPSESYIHSVEAPFDSKTVVEDLMSSGSGASTPWDPYDTSSESSSSSQYSSEGSPTAHPAVTPGAEEQALWYTSNTRQFLSGATVALSGDQYDQYWTGFDNVLTFGAALPTIKYFGSGVLDEYGFDVSMLDAWETLSSYSGRSY
ncbi:hypothetical protein C0995_009029 [Termitomyces sp. Mi166|nr:hypothetical protein C0995_009029 [Termitomyces sp. Mi166\